ncbi:MAG: acetate uptake transporter [Streptosporangiaceae bacterium]
MWKAPSARSPRAPARPAAVASSIADPVPVGIAGFAMTTFILSCTNAGFFGGTTSTPIVLGLAIFYGGLVQLVAGLWAFRRGETFPAVAFCSYGITCGVAAWYVAFAHVTNDTFGKELIPTWPLG